VVVDGVQVISCWAPTSTLPPQKKSAWCLDPYGEATSLGRPYRRQAVGHHELPGTSSGQQPFIALDTLANNFVKEVNAIHSIVALMPMATPASICSPSTKSSVGSAGTVKVAFERCFEGFGCSTVPNH
jgi:hypothetical protein